VTTWLGEEITEKFSGHVVRRKGDERNFCRPRDDFAVTWV
jgi:hypothetical protein